jgi:hypothetical protein
MKKWLQNTKSWTSFKMWTFIRKWFWYQGPFHELKGTYNFSFSIMSLCTLFRCIVNIYYITYDSLNSSTLQNHFDFPFTHLTSFFVIWKGEKTYKNIASWVLERTFLVCVLNVFSMFNINVWSIQIMNEWILHNFHY